MSISRLNDGKGVRDKSLFWWQVELGYMSSIDKAYEYADATYLVAIELCSGRVKVEPLLEQGWHSPFRVDTKTHALYNPESTFGFSAFFSNPYKWFFHPYPEWTKEEALAQIEQIESSPRSKEIVHVLDDPNWSPYDYE